MGHIWPLAWFLLGLTLGFVVPRLLEQPKLRVEGTPAGDGAMFAHRSVALYNAPLLLGIRLRERTVLGKRFEVKEWGKPWSRRAAVDCQAWLYDADAKTAPVMLSWWVDGGFVQTYTINPDGRVELMVFAVDLATGEYFAFRPGPLNRRDDALADSGAERYSATKRFVIKINHSNGFVLSKIPVVARVSDDYLVLDTKIWLAPAG